MMLVRFPQQVHEQPQVVEEVPSYHGERHRDHPVRRGKELLCHAGSHPAHQTGPAVAAASLPLAAAVGKLSSPEHS